MTLLEIMIVLAILALVMGLLVGPQVLRMFDASKVDIARSGSKKLANESYGMWVTRPGNTGKCPTAPQLAEMAGAAKDPWGEEYVVKCTDLPPGAQLLSLTKEIVATARKHIGLGVRAAVGSTVPTVDEARRSRQEADRVLDAMGRGLDADVATLDDVRSRVLVSETLALLAEHPRIRDPRLAKLDGDLARSVLAYLDAFGDVRSAARVLHVHPNTLRYRVRRAAEVSGVDLGDPLQRLFAQLQLRLA
jgi:type II secretory pathway pseudopilin PulG